jgi:hypothetical protein
MVAVGVAANAQTPARVLPGAVAAIRPPVPPYHPARIAGPQTPVVLSATSVMIRCVFFGEIELSPDSVVAYGTAVLALGTAALAFFTYRLAAAATSDQRAQWRPILIAGSEEVDESIDGELLIEVRNVGRGPALGVGGQLRIAGPSGAVIPGQPNICLPDEIMELRFSVNGEYGRGSVRHFEVTYYDIGEWWHTTDLTASIREQGGPLTVMKTFVSERNRQLLPVHGSRRAMAAAERKKKRPWVRSWHWLRRKASRS